MVRTMYAGGKEPRSEFYFGCSDEDPAVNHA